jgi:hypothetical protein
MIRPPWRIDPKSAETETTNHSAFRVEAG